MQTEDDLPCFEYENHANLCASLVKAIFHNVRTDNFIVGMTA